MRLLVLIFIALLVTGLAAWTAQVQGGEVIVHIADLTVQISLLMALLMSIAAMFGILVLIWAVSRILDAPLQLRRRKQESRRQRTDALLARGLRKLIDDAPQAARQDLEQASKIDPKHPLFHLLAASSCLRSGDWQIGINHLQVIEDADYKEVCTRLRADGLVAAGKWEEALAVLQVLISSHPENPKILRHMARCYRELNSWQRLLELAESQKDRTGVPAHESRAWRREAAQRLCEKATRENLPALWIKLGKTRNNPEVLQMYIKQLHYCGETLPDLEPHLRKLLDLRLDDELLDLYGNLPDPVTPEMIKKFQAWLGQEPKKAALHRNLARLYTRLGQFDDARKHFEATEGHGADARWYWEMGQTLERVGEFEAAQRYYRIGLGSLTENS